MALYFSQLSEILTGIPFQFDQDNYIEYLETDSRKAVLFGEQTLFFALQNKKGRNGHQFVQQAYNKGIRNFLVSEKIDLPHANVFQVDNTLTALQKLSEHHRQQFDYPILAITGSNGKTIVKEWLYQLLHIPFNIVRSPKSYNSQLGVPLSVWQMQANHNLAIFEAGISEVNEMEHLEKIIQPTIGLFTNIGPAHAANFENKEEKINEKLKLFHSCEHIIYCKDHPEIDANVQASKKSIKAFSWSLESPDSELFFSINNNVELKRKGKIVHVCKNKLLFPKGSATNFKTQNLLHCIACIWYLIVELNALKLSPKEQISRFQELVHEDNLQLLQTMPMRLSQKSGVNNCLLIDDTYNSDLYSLQIALDFQKQQNNHLKNTLVLTDILQSGIEEKSLYKKIGEIIKARSIDRFVGIGPNMQQHKNLIEPFVTKSDFYESTTDFIKAIPVLNLYSECILFKGARIFQLEKAVEQLSEKLHQTTLEINLTALSQNLKVYKSLLKPSTKMMIMVKAFSYGAGTYEIANALQFNGVDYLCVAYTDEGIALRKAGIQLPIMVLSPEPNTFAALVSHRLEPEIYNISHLQKLIYFLQQNNFDRPIDIHLNFDTGMHRLGFTTSDLPELLSILSKTKQVKVVSVFSHLMGSEDVNAKEFTHQQFSTYLNIVNQLEEALQIKVQKHICNTAGMVNYPEMQLDMVRLGLGLYGIDATKKIQDKLQLVGQFSSSIAQIRMVKKGEGIGYNWSEKLKRDSKIAIVNVGYGDGLLRKASNGRFSFKINNQQAPIIGRVCMDMCMVDVTDILEVKEGDKVVIFDDVFSMNALSQALETIPYEVLTNLSNRVKRIYVQE